MKDITVEQRKIIPEEYRHLRLYKMPMYRVLMNMVQRCTNPNHKDWKNYGGKGIKVCDEWRNNSWNFVLWAFQNGYKKGLSIDRIDSNGNYEPSNCRWITISENVKRIDVPLIKHSNILAKSKSDFELDSYNALYLIDYCLEHGEPIDPIYSYRITDFNNFPKRYYKYLADYDDKTNTFV